MLVAVFKNPMEVTLRNWFSFDHDINLLKSSFSYTGESLYNHLNYHKTINNILYKFIENLFIKYVSKNIGQCGKCKVIIENNI